MIVNSPQPTDLSLEAHTLVDILRLRAMHQPYRTAYTFLVDGEEQEVRLTYRELYMRAREIGANLQSLKLSGKQVLLSYPPGLEFIAAFFGCLIAEVVAVPAYPPRLNRGLPRLCNIIEDAQVEAVLTTASMMSKLKPVLARFSESETLSCLATDDIVYTSDCGFREGGVNNETLALIQYTSGSTSSPRGVMLTHANLLSNARFVYEACEHTPDDKYVSWLPAFHDMGLMAGVIQPLFGGFPVVLISPAAFLQRPLRWLQAISRYRATTSGGPNFAYDLCVRKIPAQERAKLDLSSWGVAFNGAEPVRAETLEHFASAFEPCGFRRESFYPCYGLAEATLMVSGSFRSVPPTVISVHRKGLEHGQVIEAPKEADDAQNLVGCGRARINHQIIIAHPESMTERLPGEVGEIWVAGQSIAKGYWKRPSETDHTFYARVARTGDGPFLRTGDLGFVHNGELFIAGRIKDLIVIRGLNHYPQDIEKTVELCHPALREGCGAAFAVEVSGEERLIIVQEVEYRGHPVAHEVIEEIRQAVAENHEIQAYAVVLLKAGSIPKTSSGKIQRHICREKFLDKSLEVWAEWQDAAFTRNESLPPALITMPQSAGALEAWLVSYVAARQGIDSRAVDTNQPLTHYGLDSLMAINLTHDIELAFGVLTPPNLLFEGSSLTQLARYLHEQSTAGGRESRRLIESPANKSSEHPLSYGQQGLWFLANLAPESAAYNIAVTASLSIDSDACALQRAFQSLVNRHSSLHTIFKTNEGGEPVQQHRAQAELDFRVEDASILKEAEFRERLTQESCHPFNLERGPLLRVIIFNRGALRPVLLLVVHHIVADFWSLEIIAHELGELYKAEQRGIEANLDTLALQYSQYARWQRERLAGAEGERLWAYWHKQLEGDLPALNLPTDHPRPQEQSFLGSSEKTIVSAGLTRQLKELARSHGATLYMALLGAFQVLLYHYTGQEDLIIGSPAAGRSRAATKGVVGYFVNLLALRASLSADATYSTFLRQVRRTTLDAFEHQDYPFTLLVDRIQPVRDYQYPPLIQSLFVWQQTHKPGLEGLAALALCQEGESITLGTLQLESTGLGKSTAQFDISLMMAELDGRLIASFNYNSDLFEPTTIRRMAEHFQTLLRTIAKSPEERLSDYSLLTTEERQQLLLEWNETGRIYTQVECVHELFEAQVEWEPDKIALVFGEERVTYEALNRQANQLAWYLRRRGVEGESHVGVLLSRTPKLLVALLGVLKAGGAYVPLDPAYPPARISYMLEDAKASVLLTETQFAEARRWGETPQMVKLDAEWPLIAEERIENVIGKAVCGNLAYVIYTSGSTGQPKGVAIEHRSAVNFLRWSLEVFTKGDLEGVVASTSICFDLSVFELFVPLSDGGKVVIAENALNAPDWYIVQETTLINTIPAAMAALVEARFVPVLVRTVNLAGEPLSKALAQGVYNLPGIERVFNLYGPTETTTYSTYVCVPNQTQATPSIGRPIANTQAYVLGEGLQPMPVGAPGELYIGGAGLARGYLGRADLTGERFIPHLWTSEPGKRLYRTGDRVRYLANGEIEFLGRSDSQVKLRGYRIELSEIEVALSQHPEVSGAVVLMREDDQGVKRLVAYASLKQGANLSLRDLREHLKTRLPEYMLPSAFVPLDAMPLTPSGKVNRRELPIPDRSRLHTHEVVVPPRTRTEETLAGIWAELLNIERVSVHDNFFELGGNSLLATRVVSRLRDAFQVEMRVASLFAAPTIAQLSAAIFLRKASMLDAQSLMNLAEKARQFVDE